MNHTYFWNATLYYEKTNKVIRHYYGDMTHNGTVTEALEMLRDNLKQEARALPWFNAKEGFYVQVTSFQLISHPRTYS